MAQFDWYVGESRWDSDTIAQHKRGVGWRTWRRPIAIVATLLGLFIGTGILARNGWQAIEARFISAEQQASREARAAWQTLAEAAVVGDTELIGSLSDSDKQDWAQLVIFERPGFALQWQNELLQAQTLIIDPTLESAEVTTIAHYISDIQISTTNDVYFEHTLYLNKVDNRWELGQPPLRSWGLRQTWRNNLFVISYPERDEAFIQQHLLPDLRVALSKARLSASNPHDVPLPIHIVFSTDPSTIETSARTLNDEGQLVLTLPTPSLVGIPADKLSYRALRNGYESPIVTSVLHYFGEEQGTQ